MNFDSASSSPSPSYICSKCITVQQSRIEIKSKSQKSLFNEAQLGSETLPWVDMPIQFFNLQFIRNSNPNSEHDLFITANPFEFVITSLETINKEEILHKLCILDWIRVEGQDLNLWLTPSYANKLNTHSFIQSWVLTRIMVKDDNKSIIVSLFTMLIRTA